MPRANDIEMEFDDKTQDYYIVWEPMVIGLVKTKQEALEDLRGAAHLGVDSLIDLKLRDIREGNTCSFKKQKGGKIMLKRREHEEEAITGAEKAKRYAESHRKYATMMYRRFLKDVKSLDTIGKCLEIGPGPGTLTAMVAERNPRLHITAVDISSDMVTVAQEYIEEKELQDRIRFIVGDAADERAMEELGQFDLVYSFFSMHHWNDPQKVITNLLKAVRDKGLLYVHDFRRAWWLRCLPLNTGDINAIKAAYTPDEVKALLQKLGVRQYEIRQAFPFFQSVIVTK